MRPHDGALVGSLIKKTICRLRRNEELMKLMSSSVVASLAIASAVLALIIPSAPCAYAQPQSRQLQQISSVNTWPGKAKRFALVIGVDQYADTQITTLGGASNDAKLLADVLVRYAGFPSDQVTLLASDQPAERQPTRGNILRRLSNLASVVPHDGLLLVSFAGHGMERGGEAFLLPMDAQVSNDVDLLEQTAVNVAVVKDRIRKTGVGQVVLILDACRNDPVGRSGSDNPLTAAYTRSFDFDVRNREVQAFATLYATSVGHRAYEYKEKHQGYFTWELVEGLKGAAANEKGEVTLASIIKYLQDRVPRHVLLDLGAGKEQRPFAVVEGYRADELVISVSRSTTLLASSAPSAGTPVDSLAIELAYWDSIKNSTDPQDFKAYLDKYPNGQFEALARRRAKPSLESILVTPESESETTSNTILSVRAIETLRGSLNEFGKKVNVHFQQDGANPGAFVGVLSQGLFQTDAFVISVKIDKTNTLLVRSYPQIGGHYLNIESASDKSGLMRSLLRQTDSNFLFTIVDRSGNIGYGYNISLESGYPDKVVDVVLRSIGNSDAFVGKIKPYFNAR